MDLWQVQVTIFIEIKYDPEIAVWRGEKLGGQNQPEAKPQNAAVERKKKPLWHWGIKINIWQERNSCTKIIVHTLSRLSYSGFGFFKEHD